jgi:hypothetical protein
MAVDPRTIDNEEQGFLALALNIEDNAGVKSVTASDIGKPVALTANNEISNGAALEHFIGKLIAVSEDGATASVQVKGVCADLPYSGTAPVLGWPVQMSGAGTVDKGITAGATRGVTLAVNSGAATCDVLL